VVCNGSFAVSRVTEESNNCARAKRALSRRIRVGCFVVGERCKSGTANVEQRARRWDSCRIQQDSTKREVSAGAEPRDLKSEAERSNFEEVVVNLELRRSSVSSCYRSAGG
jgi:hypothetical protein